MKHEDEDCTGKWLPHDKVRREIVNDLAQIDAMLKSVVEMFTETYVGKIVPFLKSQDGMVILDEPGNRVMSLDDENVVAFGNCIGNFGDTIATAARVSRIVMDGCNTRGIPGKRNSSTSESKGSSPSVPEVPVKMLVN